MWWRLRSDTNNNLICDSDVGLGCMDNTACNYDPNATQDNGTCEYPEEFYDCDGCINDADDDGVCDELEVEGCNNPAACNYDDTATDDDGSCLIIGEACDDMDSLTDMVTDLCICVGDWPSLDVRTLWRATILWMPTRMMGHVTTRPVRVVRMRSLQLR